jgi:hypothetical protein
MLIENATKNFDKKLLITTLKTLQATDPTIRSSDFKTITSMIQAMIVRGYDVMKLYNTNKPELMREDVNKPPRKQRIARPIKPMTEKQIEAKAAKQAIKEAKAAEKAKKKIEANEAKEAEKVAKRVAIEIERRKAREEKKLMKLKEREAKAAEKQAKRDAKEALKNKLLTSKQIFAKVEKRNIKDNMKLAQKEYIKAAKLNIPEADVVGPRFKGPLMPNQRRRATNKQYINKK